MGICCSFKNKFWCWNQTGLKARNNRGVKFQGGVWLRRGGFSIFTTERDSWSSQQDQDGQQRKWKWYYTMMEGYWEDELPKALEGKTTWLRKQILQGNEQINFSLTSVVFCVRYLNLAHLKNPKENLNQRLPWKWNMMHRWKARLGSCPHQCYRNRTGAGKTGRFDRFTGLAGPVSKKISKNRIFFQTGYGTGQNRPKLAKPAGLDWGLTKLNFFLKTQKIKLCWCTLEPLC